MPLSVFPQALLEFLSKVISREKRNRMNLWAVATIMAPNLFLHKAVPSRLTDGAEKGQAEKAADVMRLLIRYQDLLWTVGPPERQKKEELRTENNSCVPYHFLLFVYIKAVHLSAVHLLCGAIIST